MLNITTFARRWGLILVGIFLTIVGLIYGAIPHQTPYQSIPKSFIAHYLSGRGIGYMQLANSPTLYIVNEGKFLPAFSADYLNHGQIVISFLYRNDETTNIDASSDNNVHLVGPAYNVEQIKLYLKFGQPPEVFSTSEFTQNPKGFYQHNWTTGIVLSLLGLIFIGLGYFLPVGRDRKNKQPDFASAPAALMEEPNEQPVIDPEEVLYREFSGQTAQPPRISTEE